MKKVKNFGVPTPTVNLAINRSRIKKYNRKSPIPTYYLKKGQEFQIELYNPTQGNILARIKFNNKSISSGGLILRPGERVFLDRFIESEHKLLFETYKVSNSKSSKKAIEPNGDIKVEFFNEYVQSTYTINVSGTNTWPYGYDYSGTGGIPLTTYAENMSFTTTSMSDNVNVKSIQKEKIKQIETGRIEKGTTSKQKLIEGYGTYESNSFHSVEYKLLPISEKKVDSRVLYKSYCTECGTKNKSTYKFCPTCGKKQ